MTTTPMPAAPAPEPPKQQAVRTWRPTTAGILNIVAGGGGVISGIILVVYGVLGYAWMDWMGGIWDGRAPYSGDVIAQFILTLFSILGVVLIIMGVLTIIGGVYTLKRKKWGFGLAASIMAIILSLVLGILSTIFIAQSKKEFT